MGHKDGFEFRKMQVDAANRGISRELSPPFRGGPNTQKQRRQDAAMMAFERGHDEMAQSLKNASDK
jgi:hypothetical protein